jgi:hypothetical protein
MTSAFGLVAHVAMMLNGFVQPVVRAHKTEVKRYEEARS